MINSKALKEVCEGIHAKMAADEFGNDGVSAVFDILELLWKLYTHLEPENVKGKVLVFRAIKPGAASLSEPQSISEFSLIGKWADDSFIISIDPSTGNHSIAKAGSISAKILAKHGVVYEFDGMGEIFFAGDREAKVSKLDGAAHSQFSIPTFANIRAALNHYEAEAVRHSSCPVLNDVWADKNRVFLVPKPEAEMRRSLTWFLKNRLGAGHEVRPEQIMDESHPVYIKVTQMQTNRLAIIEIKWLGDSRTNEPKITVQHRDQRARDGAKQLADYLDMNKKQAPLHVTKGYYVIVDSRRRGLKDDTDPTTVSREDGFHYAKAEISFSPEYHKIRDDFEMPIRMFAEPLCNS